MHKIGSNKILLKAHTRWATHGQPSQLNSHPHRSDPNNEFTMVHNGIITNYKEIKTLLEKKGVTFETETDTECVAKLTKYIYDSQKEKLTFTNLVKSVVKELVSFTALVFDADLFITRCSRPCRKEVSRSSSRASITPTKLLPPAEALPCLLA